MYKVRENKLIGEGIYLMVVEAPLVVKKFLPGQFAIVMSNANSERIPLTIYDVNKEEGLLYLIYQVVGASTLELAKNEKELFSVVGPLGKPSELVVDVDAIKDKKVVFVAGGVGIAPVYPQVKLLREAGVDVDVIYGAKSKKFIILEDEIRKLANLTVATDDGSYGEKGFVTDVLKNCDKKYDICVAIGPIVMMKFVSKLTEEMGIKQIVSMNPIMVDGTGMCGACRLVVNGEVKFACVDGPEFDGHQVDFDGALKRMDLYQTFEGRAYLKAMEGDTHHGGCGNC